MPQRPEIVALRHEGRPWFAIAGVAEEFLAIEESLRDLAWKLILPDDEIRWRLFHLAVLGVLLTELRLLGCSVLSRRPLGGISSGPNYSIIDPSGFAWDLWFESASVLTYEGEDSPFSEAAKGVPGAGRSLGADILLIQPGSKALVLECKYSANPDTVARGGYLQASTYAMELHSRLGVEVTALVVGPASVVKSVNYTNTCLGRIGIGPPAAIRDAVSALFLS